MVEDHLERVYLSFLFLFVGLFFEVVLSLVLVIESL